MSNDTPDIMEPRLWRKNGWHSFRAWDGWSHDWSYWTKMLQLYIGGHD